MSKEYLVTTIDRVRTVYVVPAESEAEARTKIENFEESYHVSSQEYYDLESIEEVTPNE